MSACVPKATETKAVCGTNQAFNSVTRSCYNTIELRTKPVATSSAFNLTQETASTLTLLYTDTNKDSAISCRITTFDSSKIEIISPQVLNGNIFAQTDLIFDSAQEIRNALNAGVDKMTADGYVTAMQTAMAKAKATFTYSTLTTQLGLFETAANNLLTLVSNNGYVASITLVKYYYDLTLTRQINYNLAKTSVLNRCSCSGGICTTTVVPRMRINGAAGFTYAITDIDGEGDARPVALTIAATSSSSNYLKPAVESSYISTFVESATPYPSSYSFSLPTPSDYFTASAFTYSFTKPVASFYFPTLAMTKTYVPTDSGLGKVTDCLGLGGSALTDTSCIFIPNSGDSNDSITPALAQTPLINDLVFKAKAEGTFANNYTVQYFSLTNLPENFGLVSMSYPDTFVRVNGNAIQIYLVKGITSSTDIKNLINADMKAKALVAVTGGALTTFPDPAVSTPSAVSLSGGTDAFDTVSFSVNNGFASSTNAATVMFKMTPVEDAPLFNSVASTSVTAAEDSGQITINLTATYSDAENNVDSCDVDPISSALFLTNFTVDSCSCTASPYQCILKVTPATDVSSTTPYTLYYRVGSVGQFTGYKAYSVNVTPVNDAPTISAPGLQTIPENTSTVPSSSFATVTVSPGGGGFETSQSLALTVTSDRPTLIPNTPCQGYTPGAGTPIGSFTPGAIGDYYFDTTNKKCYKSTGTTNTAWGLYPSLTAFPKCLYESFGQGTPSVTPTAAGKYYLDTFNNICYVSTAATASSWIKDNTLTNFYVAFVPVLNQSSAPVTNITMSLKDTGGGTDTTAGAFTISVTPVDDPPVFTASIPRVDTNEGGMVVAGPFKVDEDLGSTADEDIQNIHISAITSDNTSVLANATNSYLTSSIKVFYDLNDNGVQDSGEERNLSDSLDIPSADAKLHAFYLKIYPIAGVSGNSNITITVNDDGGALATHSITKTFSLIVHSVAALHGGWANISATGLKTDKNGAPASDLDVVCNFNLSGETQKCNSNQDCTGSGSPAASVLPSAANILYWDSGNKKCYRSTGTTVYSWLDLKTTCPITRVAGVNWISSTPYTPSAVGQYYFDPSDNTCYVSTGTTVTDWIAYVPAKITLAWNSFNITGSGADATVTQSGWNVYRREAGRDYDFVNGYLKNADKSITGMTLTNASIRTFTDTTAVAGKVYYYLVRPVDSRTSPTSAAHLTISTSEIFSEVRILAPTENYTFVHRWMVNQEICNNMHMTTSTSLPNQVDPTHNYRCPYKGPGESATYPGYYDIGKDLLVDIAESGCPYTASPSCTTNGCIGIGAPSSMSADAAGNIYYDRSSGVCYLANSVTSGDWTEFNTATQTVASVTKLNTSLNAPLVNITEASAAAICTNRKVGTKLATALAGPTPLVAASTLALPSKKEYIAYSAAPFAMTDALVTDLEQGFSLNVQSRCNSANANGIDTAFNDSPIPSTSFIYSLPGTASSGIRSIYTGSVKWANNFSTETCSSRYGIQDVYGNVAEWVKDKMTCNAANYICTSVAGASGTELGRYDFSSGTYTNTPSNPYAFDNVVGPFNDISANSIPDAGDGFLDNWDFRNELYGAGKFSFPMGMPIFVDINSGVLASSVALPFLLDIGPTAGITTSQLHEDGLIVNGAAINNSGSNPTQIGTFAQGGSYLSGNRSGRYSSELVPDATALSKRPDIGFRCILPIAPANFPADSIHPYSAY